MRIDYSKLVIVLAIALLTGGLHLCGQLGVSHAAWAPYLAIATVALSGALGALRSFVQPTNDRNANTSTEEKGEHPFFTPERAQALKMRVESKKDIIDEKGDGK